MDYKEIRKQYIKPALKHLLEDWLDRFSVIMMLIFLLTIATVGFTKICVATEVQRILYSVSLVAVWIIIPVFYHEV